jgi:hypothetical protein
MLVVASRLEFGDLLTLLLWKLVRLLLLVVPMLLYTFTWFNCSLALVLFSLDLLAGGGAVELAIAMAVGGNSAGFIGLNDWLAIRCCFVKRAAAFDEWLLVCGVAGCFSTCVDVIGFLIIDVVNDWLSCSLELLFVLFVIVTVLFKFFVVFTDDVVTLFDNVVT